VKKIVLIIILLLGSYYFFSNENQKVEFIEKDVFSNVIDNIEDNKTENINVKNEIEENLENNNSEFNLTKNEISVYSENNYSYDKNQSILNMNTDFIDKEELEIEMDSMFSDFIYEFSEKENLDPDDFKNMF
jgi:hypothetical protein